MGSEFTFYDYVDQGGANPVRAWLEELGHKGRTRFDNIIYNLQATPPAEWSRPAVDTMTGECSGLWELRAKIDKVQRRLLGFHGPGRRECTLVFGAIEKDRKLEPASACRQAQRRKTYILVDPDRRRREHDFASAT